MKSVRIEYDPLHKGSIKWHAPSNGWIPTSQIQIHLDASPELPIHRYPVSPEAVSELSSLFPAHDVSIMRVITTDGKDEHHPAEFERILRDALVTVSPVSLRLKRN